MVPNEVPCGAGRQIQDVLAALNSSPLAFLAGCGVAHGEAFGRSFIRAQEILDRHGTSRRIEDDHASKLCFAMRIWAEGGPVPRTV